MPVDVLTDIEIARSCSDVASYAANPDNAPSWYANIKSVEWETEPPLRIGSKIAFVTYFLGRRMAYTYEVIEYVPAAILKMRASQGPFPMETTYRWDAIANNRTQMSLRDFGEPGGFSRLLVPLMAAAIRRANRKDFALLKNIVESGTERLRRHPFKIFVACYLNC